MHRFYVSGIPVENSVAITESEHVHHIREVLRLKVNDEVILFDETGTEYSCTIKEMDKQQVILAIKNRRAADAKSVRLTIACAIPKQTRMDDIVDKLTQLGVDVIIPMETERVIVKLDDKGKAARVQRWRKIARSAAEQSQQNRIPLVQAVTSFEEVIAHSKDYDLKLIPHLTEEKKHIREILAETKAQNIIVLIGPEGDFTPQEVQGAQEAGFVPVSLGKPVLRVDTAAIAVASYISLMES